MTNQAQPETKSHWLFGRRQRFIVDKHFQYRLIGLLVSVWAANTVFFALALYFLYQKHFLGLYGLTLPGATPLFSTSALFVTIILLSAGIGTVLVAIIGIFVSHHISGPIYRVKVSLNRIAEGDINFRVQFRKYDFMKDLADCLNDMLTRLRERSEIEAQVLTQIEKNLEDTNRTRPLVRELRENKEAQLNVTPSDEAPLSLPASW